jgi:hypothetical protein
MKLAEKFEINPQSILRIVKRGSYQGDKKS